MSFSSKHAVSQKDSMRAAQSLRAQRREVSMIPPMTKSSSQPRRAAKERRKESMDEGLSGGRVAESLAVSVALGLAVAFAIC